MVVDEAVAAALRTQSYAQLAVFVAGCAERMAQVITGLVGGDSGRSVDVDVVIRLVEDLWGIEAPVDSIRGHVQSLEEFSEFEPRDVEIVDVAGIYSFYSVLVLRYATLYRLSADISYVFKCAHAIPDGDGAVGPKHFGSWLF